MINNGVYSIAEDDNGILWIGTDGGVSQLDRKRESFSDFKSMAEQSVLSIIKDKKGNTWLGTYKGLFRWDGTDKTKDKIDAQLTKYTTEKGLISNTIHCLKEDKAGNIWIGTPNGVSRLNTSGKLTFTNYTTDQGLADNFVNYIIEDNNGNIYFSTLNGVSRLNHWGKCLTAYTKIQGLADSFVSNILEDRDGNTWFSTNAGISRLNKDGKTITNYTTAQGLNDYLVSAIHQDRKGNIWFNTAGDGISRLSQNLRKITTYGTSQGLASSYISSILEDKKGEIWFGTWYEGGVSRYDGQSFTTYTTAQGLANDAVYCILEDKKGNIWFGTNGGGVSCFDGKFFTTYTTDQGLANNVLNCMLEDKYGNIWFGTDGGGISRFDGKSFKNYSTSDGMSSDAVYDMVTDKEGSIWLGTGKGFTVLKGFTKPTTFDPESSMVVDWQPSNKLSNYELESSKFKPVFEIYNVQTGYPIKDIIPNAMHVTYDDKIWAGTGDKLIKFDYKAIHKNPNPPVLFIQNIKINSENICWYDLKMSQEKIDSNVTAPNIIEEASLFGRALKEVERDTMRRKYDGINFDSITRFYPVPVNLVLPYRHNNITFDFAAIEPARPMLVNYQHMLEGYNNNWSPASNEKNATFGNIREGTYTFKLKAQSPDGVWSKPLTYTFKVLPPLWRTWWAYSLYCLILLAVLWMLFKWRISALKKEKALLEEKVENRTHELHKEKEKVESTLTELKATQAQLIQLEKTNERLRISRELHDDIGSTLGSISIYSEVAKNRTEKNENPEEALSKIGSTSRELIDKMSDIVWSLNPNNESFEQLENRMMTFAAIILTPRNITYDFIADKEIKKLPFKNEQLKNIFLIYKEAVHNIVKYADCKKVSITFSKEQNTVTMTIKDDGKGFDFVMQNSGVAKVSLGGNGIKNMHTRAEDINGTLNIDSMAHQGTSINLTLSI